MIFYEPNASQNSVTREKGEETGLYNTLKNGQFSYQDFKQNMKHYTVNSNHQFKDQKTLLMF